jgi:hypothetical protein
VSPIALYRGVKAASRPARRQQARRVFPIQVNCSMTIFRPAKPVRRAKSSSRPRPLMIAGVILCAATSALEAQIPQLSFPPTGTLPNYDRVPIGQVEGLESGAFVARTGDAGSGWYNPAGLVLSEKSGLNASSNAYELNSVTLEGFTTVKSGVRFSPIGTYFGAVLGAPVIHSPNFRLAFFYAKPVSWSPSLIDGTIRATNGPTTEFLGYSTTSNFSTITPGLAAGVRLSRSLRVGGGISLGMTNLQQQQTLSDRLISATSDTTGLRAVSVDGSTNQLLFTGGLQWDLGPKVKFGAMVVSPGVRMGGHSKMLYSLTGFSTNGSVDVVFRDENARFEYRIPLRLTAGIAVISGRFEFEGDVRYHGSTGAYELLHTDVLANTIVTNAAGVPTIGTATFAAVSEQAKSVVNVAVGGSYGLSKVFRLHAGFFSDASPVDDAAESAFRTVDLFGGSLGVSFTLGHLSGSLGAASSAGTTKDRTLGASLGGLTTTTRLKVTTFNFMYAISYKF